MYTIELYDYKGNIDCFGHRNREDRFVVLNAQGMDETGSNFTREEAEEMCEELNEETNTISTIINSK